MKAFFLMAVALLLVAWLLSVQAAQKPETPPKAPAAAPVLTDSEKNSILLAQRQILEVAVQMKDLQNQYSQLDSRRQSLNDEVSKAIATVQKRIGDSWVIDPEKLTVSAKPAKSSEAKP